MMNNKKVFAFDLGKASIGFCAREGFNVLDLGSLIIDKDHAEMVSNRDRRRVHKTLQAHKAREEFFNTLWKDCGLEILEKNDKRFTIEFANKNDSAIYNSTLLRIALLQNKTLEEWQIYKALHSAIQRRGYDVNLAWANANSDDEKKNRELSDKYTKDDNGNELINNEDYKYPCYYDATRLGLWNEDNPNELKRYLPLIGITKVRDAGIVAPRQMVEKELKQLFLNAQKQISELNKYSVEYFLYGEYEEAYGSYKNPKFKKYRGTVNDWQGVLGQKIPRFDNRIIAKCKLLPKRNVCKANTVENVSFVLLMKLKNLRFTTKDGEKCILDASAIREIYTNWLNNAIKENGEYKLDTTIIKKEIENVIANEIQDKIEPMKANISGRSSFCRRACQIMNKIILDGIENPVEMDLTDFVDKEGAKNGITEEEIRTMLAKVGTWDNLFVPDNRYEMAEMSSDDREKTDLLIGNITNPIVRNRLQIFRDKLLEMKYKFGTPNEVIFEFVRDGADNSLFGQKKAQDALKFMKENEKKNEELVQKLKDNNAFSTTNFDKLKLLEMQNGCCIYSGRKMGVADLDKCEIDHIFPRSMGGNDALYNRVLCYAIENQNKKDRTPYEWLHNDEKTWYDYVNHLTGIKEKLGKKKFELLTSKPEDCEKLIESYNGLAETAQIARVAQEITAFVFGWGMQTKGDNRKIFVNNGSSTSSIRRRYGLNKILGDDIKKNRDNDKHHALDAICISFSRDFKYDKDIKKDVIDGFSYEFAKTEIDKLIPYPYANKKPFKGNVKPLETVYGKREIEGKTYITKRIAIADLAKKDKVVKTIIDKAISEDLLGKLNLSDKEWKDMLQNYQHPKKKTLVKKVLTIESEGTVVQDSSGRTRIGEFVDFGTKGVKNQFKHSKGHKGQILYYNEKGSIKVMPVYANKKLQDVKDELEQMGCKLYKKGMMFYSGCLIEVPNDFKAGSNTCPAGIYKLRTIIADTGSTKVENQNGIEILTSANYLAQADFKKLNR